MGILSNQSTLYFHGYFRNKIHLYHKQDKKRSCKDSLYHYTVNFHYLYKPIFLYHKSMYLEDLNQYLLSIFQDTIQYLDENVMLLYLHQYLFLYNNDHQDLFLK